MKTLVCVMLLLPCFSFGNYTVLDQLKQVNPEWDSKPIFSSSLLDAAINLNEQELIKQHLKFTITYLQAKHVKITEEQRLYRKYCLQHLTSYMEAGVFPENTLYTTRNPCFIDDKNNYCAVGYLLKQTGFNNTARQIQQEMNYAYIRQIPLAYLQGIIDKCGFTIEELALIQPGYAPNLVCKNDTFFVSQSTPTICPFLANDIITKGSCSQNLNSATVTLLSSPVNGNAVVTYNQHDTIIIYTPNGNYLGADSMTYEIKYGQMGFCYLITDTATITFNVISSTGNLSTFKPGDANYDGKVNNADMVMIAKNLGQQGPARTFINTHCDMSYCQSWSTQYLNYNIASCDVDGSGTVSSIDWDLAHTCFDKEWQAAEFYTSAYSLVVEPYDTLITTNDKLNFLMSVKINGTNNSIPVKAISMEISHTGNGADLLGSSLALSPIVDTSTSSILNYTINADSSMYPTIYIGATAISKNVSPQISIPFNFFILSGQAISVLSNATTGLTLKEIRILDDNDNVIAVNKKNVLLKTWFSTSVIEPSSTNIIFSPNPATHYLIITTNNNQLGSITVFSLTGMQLLQQSINSKQTFVSVESLPSGIYIAEIQTSEGTVKKKWVKM